MHDFRISVIVIVSSWKTSISK